MIPLPVAIPAYGRLTSLATIVLLSCLTIASVASCGGSNQEEASASAASTLQPNSTSAPPQLRELSVLARLKLGPSMGFLNVTDWRIEASSPPRLWISGPKFSTESPASWLVVEVSPALRDYCIANDLNPPKPTGDELFSLVQFAYPNVAGVSLDSALPHLTKEYWNNVVPKKVGEWMLLLGTYRRWEWIERSGVAVDELVMLRELEEFFAQDTSAFKGVKLTTNGEIEALTPSLTPRTRGMTESKHIQKILEKQYPDSKWWKSHPYFELAEKLWAAANEEYRKAQEEHHKRNPGG